jgi:hypothetical protein
MRMAGSNTVRVGYIDLEPPENTIRVPLWATLMMKPKPNLITKT